MADDEDASKKKKDDAALWWARTQAILGFLALLVALIGIPQQLGALESLTGIRLPIPQFINITGVQLEMGPITPREGQLRSEGVVVTEAPRRGRWKARLCPGDEVQFINGFEVSDLNMARSYLYADRGDFVTVRTNEAEPHVGRVYPVGVARNCPSL